MDLRGEVRPECQAFGSQEGKEDIMTYETSIDYGAENEYNSPTQSIN